MNLDWKHWLFSHLIWIIALVVGYVGLHSYLQERDARLLAEQQIKISEQVVKGLKDQIKANNDQIATLQKSIDDVNKAAQRKIDVIVQQQERVKTPAQAIPAIAETNPELDAHSIPDAPDYSAVKAIPLFTTLSQCRITDAKLDACTKNLDTETKIAAKNDDNYQKQVAITAEKQKEIDSLKKPKGFWSKVKGTAKSIGIGIGIGLGLSKAL
ncbi:MAG TPA: hypothetical protein VN577_10165 [Terriglobales bacterium]|nr:hypothetical protein [Terriglobales bacterium]